MSKQNFIMTSDISTINKLKELNFQIVEEKNGFVKFLNNSSKINFEDNDIDKNKITYTNKLSG